MREERGLTERNLETKKKHGDRNVKNSRRTKKNKKRERKETYWIE